jgi:tripartite motif-containing protein 71
MQLLSRFSSILSVGFLCAFAVTLAGCGGGGSSLPYAQPQASRFIPTAGTIYVLTNNNQFQMFAPNAGSGATALSSFSSGVLKAPTGIAVDGQGTVYVAQAPNIYSYNYAAYVGGGNVSPSTTLTTVAGPWGLTIAPNGFLVATDSVNNSVDFFGPGSNGNAQTFATISGSNTDLASPYQAAFDGSGNLYVLNTAGNNGNGSVTVYSAGAFANKTGNINVAPTAVITSSASSFSSPRALAVDSSGNVYVGNDGNDTIAVFGPGSNGFVSPTATVNGYSTFCTCQATMTVMSNNLYVAGWNTNSVVIYAPITSSSATPLATITSATLGQTEGVGVIP